MGLMTTAAGHRSFEREMRMSNEDGPAGEAVERGVPPLVSGVHGDVLVERFDWCGMYEVDRPVAHRQRPAQGQIVRVLDLARRQGRAKSLAGEDGRPRERSGRFRRDRPSPSRGRGCRARRGSLAPDDVIERREAVAPFELEGPEHVDVAVDVGDYDCAHSCIAFLADHVARGGCWGTAGIGMASTWWVWL